MFIAIEGIAGAGKTTLASSLANYLSNTLGKTVSITEDYEHDRKRWFDETVQRWSCENDPISATLLFNFIHKIQANEVQHLLNQDTCVVADRWRDSFLIHHEAVNTFKDTALAEQLSDLAYGTLSPDICIFLDLPPDIAHKRYITREQNANKRGLPLADFDYFEKVTAIYRRHAKERNWIVIDANQGTDTVLKNVVQALSKMYV